MSSARRTDGIAPTRASARGRDRRAASSGRSELASAIQLGPLDRHGSDADSNGLLNSRSQTERRTQSQSRQWRATVPATAPTASRSSPCDSPPCDSRECTRRGDSDHAVRIARTATGATARADALAGRRVDGAAVTKSPAPCRARCHVERVAYAALRLRLKPRPVRPRPSSAREPGSGTDVNNAAPVLALPSIHHPPSNRPSIRNQGS